MGSQDRQGFHPTVRDVQPWSSQGEARLDFLELLPCDLTSLTAATQHPTPTSLAGAMQAVERPEISSHPIVGIMPLQD